MVVHNQDILLRVVVQVESASQVKPDSQSLASNGHDLSAVNERKPGEEKSILKYKTNKIKQNKTCTKMYLKIFKIISREVSLTHLFLFSYTMEILCA